MRIVRQLFGPSTPRPLRRFTPGARHFRPSPSSLFAAVFCCLAAALPAVAADPDSAPGTAPVAHRQMPAPPQITNFTATYQVGNICVFSGDVVAAAPGGLTVFFGGEPVSLQGLTTVTDANGHFSITVTMNGMRNDTGVASAQTKDAFGQLSNEALDVVVINN
jgi:hypothetical protein